MRWLPAHDRDDPRHPRLVQRGVQRLAADHARRAEGQQVHGVRAAALHASSVFGCIAPNVTRTSTSSSGGSVPTTSPADAPVSDGASAPLPLEHSRRPARQDLAADLSLRVRRGIAPYRTWRCERTAVRSSVTGVNR